MCHTAKWTSCWRQEQAHSDGHNASHSSRHSWRCLADRMHVAPWRLIVLFRYCGVLELPPRSRSNPLSNERWTSHAQPYRHGKERPVYPRTPARDPRVGRRSASKAAMRLRTLRESTHERRGTGSPSVSPATRSPRTLRRHLGQRQCLRVCLSWVRVLAPLVDHKLLDGPPPPYPCARLRSFALHTPARWRQLSLDLVSCERASYGLKPCAAPGKRAPRMGMRACRSHGA